MITEPNFITFGIIFGNSRSVITEPVRFWNSLVSGIRVTSGLDRTENVLELIRQFFCTQWCSKLFPWGMSQSGNITPSSLFHVRRGMTPPIPPRSSQIINWRNQCHFVTCEILEGLLVICLCFEGVVGGAGKEEKIDR